MEITEPRRLYQQLAAELKARIEQGVYLVGDKLPAERFIADEKRQPHRGSRSHYHAGSGRLCGGA